MAPLASAWAFYFFVRGLRSGRRNDFLWLGLILGAGLYTYTAFRIVPLAVALGWAAVWLAARRHDLGRRWRWENLGLTVLTASLVFIPLAGFALTYPESFWKRTSWYVDQYPDIPYPGLVFLRNLVNLALMFHWRGDTVAVSALPGQPVLDPILGGLLVLGAVIAAGRAICPRDPLTLGLLDVGAISMLPSALVLSHPGENPSVMRTSCGIPVVFTITALPLGLWTQGIWEALRRRGLRLLAATAQPSWSSPFSESITIAFSCAMRNRTAGRCWVSPRSLRPSGVLGWWSVRRNGSTRSPAGDGWTRRS
jgi:hypothetical protein